MTSQRSGASGRPPGRALPRVRVAPRSVDSDGDLAVQLAAGYGLVADDWQEDELDTWLSRRRDGRYAAATACLAVARQNGKNGVIEIRELYGMVELGERFLHTAHEVKTARKAFLRIAGFFENEREYPELTALVKEVRKTNGQEAIFLTTGGSIEFIARSKGSGRGFTVDVLVCDEAQELADHELEALLPTISAAPLGNPQMIVAGTPPDPERVAGEVFRRLRREALDRRDPHLAFSDYGVADGPLPDVEDRALWYETNPALGVRLHIGELERELATFTPEGFARERLGWWGDPTVSPDVVLDPAPWGLLRDDTEDLPLSDIAFGVTVSMDRNRTYIGAAGRRDDGKVHVELAAEGRGIAWALQWLADRAKTWKPVAVVLSGTAETLELPLTERGVEPTTTTGRERSQATVAFYDAFEAAELTHPGEPLLDAAAEAARKKALGTGWVWVGEGHEPLEAVTLAHHGVLQNPPKPPAPPPTSVRSGGAGHGGSETADLVTAGF